MPRMKASGMLSLAMTLFVPALLAQNTNPANPGTINYVEGQATLNGQSLSSNSVGQVVGLHQTIATENGKAEILLTPGVFLRLGSNSSATMVSPDLTNTEVQLDRGAAEVEVDQLYKQNHLLIDQGSAQTELLQRGLYEFDVNSGTMRVFDGKAAVSPSQDAKKWITVKGGHELALTGEPDKTQSFNKEQAANQDPLYSWSKLRSEYLGQANLNLAEEYASAPGYYPGWAWDPALYGYTWLPGDGMFWSPFGFGFYSPLYLYGGGYIYPGYAFRGVYRGGYGFHGTVPVTRAPVSGFRAPVAGGFRSGGFGGGGAFRGGGGRR